LLESVGAEIDPRIRNSLEISRLFDLNAVFVLYEPSPRTPRLQRPEEQDELVELGQVRMKIMI
jgi:hypothetical protein